MIDCTPTGASITGAAIGVAQHARHDLAAFERLDVGVHRPLRAGAASHVAVGLGAQHLARALLQPVHGDRQARQLPRQAAPVDLELEVGQ
jgi:hypothetical protein